jgi:hypothetical protein
MSPNKDGLVALAAIAIGLAVTLGMWLFGLLIAGLNLLG